MRTVTVVCLCGIALNAYGSGRYIYHCKLVHLPKNVRNAQKLAEDNLFDLRNSGIGKEYMDENRDRIRKYMEEDAKGSVREGEVQFQVNDTSSDLKAFGPVLGGKKDAVLRIHMAYDGQNTLSRIDLQPTTKIFRGDHRNYFNLIGDHLFLGGHMPALAREIRKTTTRSGQIVSYSLKVGYAGNQELDAIYEHGNLVSGTAYLVNEDGKRVIRATYKLSPGFNATKGDTITVTRYLGTGRPAVDEFYRLVAVAPDSAITVNSFGIAAKRPVADFRLGDNVQVNYLWNGNLPSQAELRQIKDKQNEKPSNPAIPDLRWVGAGLVLSGIYIFARAGKRRTQPSVMGTSEQS